MKARAIKPTTPKRPRTPAGTCLYAVGDVHGRLDLLDLLTSRIRRHAESLPADTIKRIVMLGDYVDRGPESQGVIATLVGIPPEGFERVCLKGNHESLMEGFLTDPTLAGRWLKNGGLATLESYGIAPEAIAEATDAWLSQQFAAILPESHRRFLSRLPLFYHCGDYYFAHAGVDPSLRLEEQSEESLMWIRKPFLTSRKDFGRVVVHGHTIVDKAEIHPNRIAIDTGAYAGGPLTCVVLHDDERLFLTARL